MLLCFTLPQNIAVLLYKSASRHNYPRPFSAYFMGRTHTRGIFDIFKTGSDFLKKGAKIPWTLPYFFLKKSAV